eukprot:COSAG02_NODE_901_length_16056_cov_52.549477_8_plen_158_part_00
MAEGDASLNFCAGREKSLRNLLDPSNSTNLYRTYSTISQQSGRAIHRRSCTVLSIEMLSRSMAGNGVLILNANSLSNPESSLNSTVLFSTQVLEFRVCSTSSPEDSGSVNSIKLNLLVGRDGSCNRKKSKYSSTYVPCPVRARARHQLIPNWSEFHP